MAACSVDGPVRFSGSNPGERASAAKFRRLAKSVLLGTVWRGDAMMRTLKEAASSIRRQVFEEDRASPTLFFGLIGALGWTQPERALQLSYIGRALPFGSARVVQESLDTHKQVMGTLSVTPPMILAAARPWARKWAETHRLDFSGFKPVSLQESSCLEFTRKEGGFAKGVSRVLVGANPPLPTALPSEVKKAEHNLFARLRGVVRCSRPPASSSSVPEAPYRKVIAGMHYRDGKPRAIDGTHGVVVSLPERGFKARIVSRHHSARVTFLHQFRLALAEALRRDRRIREVVAGQSRRAVETMFVGARHDGVLLSADLTAASDRLPHDLLREIWAGLADSAKFPPGVTLEDVLHLAIGPYDMQYPDGTSVTMQQGILMGLPTTWPLLCLVMAFWADLSNEAPDKGGSSTVTHPLGESERICGDDLIAWWRPERVALFEDIAQACGAKFSAGKHLRSRRWGIFTEEIFDVRVNVKAPKETLRTPASTTHARKRAFGWHKAAQRFVERELNASLPTKYCPRVIAGKGPLRLSTDFGRWARCIPLRWAVRVPRREAGSPVQSLPEWYCIGPATWSVAASTGMWKAVANVRSVMFPAQGRELAEAGIPPFLPRSLGGGGLALPSGPSTRVGRVASRLWRRAIGSGIYRSQPTDLPASAWRAASSPAYELASREAKKLLDRPEYQSTRWNAGRPGFSFKKLGDLEDYLEGRSAKSILWAVLEKRASLTGDVPVSIHRVAKSVHREVTRLARKGGFLSSSAPLGRLVRKHHPRALWVSEPEEKEEVGGGVRGQSSRRGPPLRGTSLSRSIESRNRFTER